MALIDTGAQIKAIPVGLTKFKQGILYTLRELPNIK